MIQRLVRDGYLNKLKVKPLPACDSYLEAKMTKKSFLAKEHRAKKILGLVHSNICGPMNKEWAMNISSFSPTITLDSNIYIPNGSKVRISD